MVGETPQARPKIALLVLAHGDAPLLLRLCNHFRDHTVFVHVDAKSRDFPVEQFAALENVVVVKPRVAVHWAGYSMVEATLAMLRSAIDRDERFVKFVLISGGCYPVKPIASLADMFDKDNGHNYIRFTEVGPSSFLRRLMSRHWLMAPLLPDGLLEGLPWLRAPEKSARAVLNKLSSYYPRDFRQEIGLKPYFGNSWWAFSDPCARYLVDFVQKNPGFVRPFRTTYATDEIFYHTIVANSPFAASADGAQPDLGQATNQAAPLHFVHPSEKRTFGASEADFELARSTDKWFVRKVSSEASAALLDRIDQELL
jgi:hypothetical protein